MAPRTKEREEFLKDVLIAVVEDFCYNSWRQILGGTYSFGEGRVVIIELEGNDNGSDKRYPVTFEDMGSGINRIINTPTFSINSGLLKTIRKANRENDASDIDAELADIILQAHLFGEIVYG